MSPYNKKNKVNDIEHPAASIVHGRDTLGTNAGVPAINKTSIDLQDEQFNLEYINKIK